MAVNLFDANFYRAFNPDLAGLDDAQAFQHLLNIGLNEGRVFSPYIDLNLYRSSNPDLATAGLTSNRQLYDHLQNAGVAESRVFSPVFNPDFYRATNPDLAAAGLNNEQLFDHFRGSGINEGRPSAPNFNVSFYLSANPDLAAAGLNFFDALQHYVFAGMAEGRIAAAGGPGPVAPPPPPPPPPAPAPVSEPGSTPETAADLGIFSGTRTFDNFVGSADSNDYYRFTLNEVKDFSLTLGGMTDNAQVELYLAEEQVDGSLEVGDEIAFSYNSGDSDESISRSLGAGTYYVRVFPRRTTGDDTRYRLELTATPTGIGDTAAPVFNMGVLSGTQTFTDFVGSADSNDYYRFTLNEVKDFSLTLGGMTDNAQVELYLAEEQVDGSLEVGDEIAFSYNSRDSDESISRSLGAGTYYVRVFPYNTTAGNTKYTLRLIADGGTTAQSPSAINLGDSAIASFKNDPLTDSGNLNEANLSAIETFTPTANLDPGNGSINTVAGDLPDVATADIVGVGVEPELSNIFSQNGAEGFNPSDSLSLV